MLFLRTFRDRAREINHGRCVPSFVGTRRGGLLMGRGWNPDALIGTGIVAALSRLEGAVKGGLVWQRN